MSVVSAKFATSNYAHYGNQCQVAFPLEIWASKWTKVPQNPETTPVNREYYFGGQECQDFRWRVTAKKICT